MNNVSDFVLSFSIHLDDRNMRSSRATISCGGYRDYEDEDEVEVDEGRKLRSGHSTISRGGYRNYEDEEVDEGRKLRSSRVTTSRGGSRGNVHYDEEDGRGTGRTASREAIEDSRNELGDLIYDDDDELQGKNQDLSIYIAHTKAHFVIVITFRKTRRTC
jgi:hypothetical protein